MSLEQLGVPTATLVASDFLEMARVVNEANRIPGLPIVEVPSPFQALTDEEIENLAKRITAAVATAFSNVAPGRARP